MSIPEEKLNELETDETEQGDGNQESTDFESINPDELPEALKPIYNNMLADYTRSKQELSEQESQMELLKQDSETLEYLLSNPKIRAIASGLTDDQPESEGEKVKYDPASQPEKYLEQLMGDVVDKKVSKQMADLKATLMPLLSDRNQQMAQTEWQGVVTKYPAAQSINVNQVNRILVENPKLSMEQAAILADPSITTKTARTIVKTPPKVEIATRSGATAKETSSALNRSQQLRQAYDKQPQGTTMSSIIRSALSKIGGGK